MNLLNVLTTVYGKLHNYPGIPFWLLTPFRKIVRSIANVVLPAYLERKHKVFLLNGHGVIVSFTSFPARIQDVWKVVESLKNQTICPDKILLWLSKDQFPSKENVPHRLIECEDDLFEIRMVDGNIRSHKKYFYAMREFPRSTIITCDDDIYYHPKMLESLIKTGKKYPGCIIANVTKQMLFDGNGDLLPYYKWNGDFKPFSSLNNVQIGAGGVLYPPGSLHKFVLKKDLFSKLAPLADDLWLNCMARLQKTPVIQTDFNVLPLGMFALPHFSTSRAIKVISIPALSKADSIASTFARSSSPSWNFSAKNECNVFGFLSYEIFALCAISSI